MTLPIERYKEAYTNWRYNPFSGADMAVDATEDGLIIPAGSPFLIQLLELPRWNDPRTVLVRNYGQATTVDADSASGQKVLNVASTTGFSPSDTIIINRGGAREEEKIIDTIQAGVSLTVTVNLTYEHTAVQADDVEKYIAFTETDGAPAQSQFRVDYPPDDGDGTGLVEFNQNDATKEVRIKYKATGSPIIEEYLNTKISYPALTPGDDQIVGFSSGVPFWRDFDHVLVSGEHTASGLTIGNVIRATGAAAFAWAQLQHTDLGGVSADQHHSQSHTHAHSSITGVSSDQHHALSHTLASHSSKAHSELTGIGINDHHNQAHTLASHSTKAHTELTGVSADQHHAKLHLASHHVGGGDLINHDSLTGFLANEHIDWTAASQDFATTGIAKIGTYNYLSSLYSATDNVWGYNAKAHASDGSKLKSISGAGTIHPQAILMGPGGMGIRFLTMDNNPGADADIVIASYERMRIKPDGDIQAYGGFGVAGKFDLGTPGELTISGGAITVTRSYHEIETEGGGGSDYLDTINGGRDGMMLIIRTGSIRDVIVRDDVGNIHLAGGNFTMDKQEDRLMLLYESAAPPGAGWYEISRSDNIT